MKKNKAERIKKEIGAQNSAPLRGHPAIQLFFPLFLTTLLFFSSALASTSTYYLDTSRMEIRIAPATHTVSAMIKATSNSDHPIRLKVIAKRWHLSPEGLLTYDQPSSPSETSPTTAQGTNAAPVSLENATTAPAYDLLDNITINPEEFDLLPGKSRIIRFLVKTPEGIPDGEWPFQLVFEPTTRLGATETTTNPNTGEVSNVIDVVPIFTTTVYLLQGNPVPHAQVQAFQCLYHSKTHQLEVTLHLNNTGTRHARLFGNVLITAKGSSTPLDVLHLNNNNLVLVFPNGIRQFHELIPFPSPSKPEASSTASTPHLDNLPPGTYQAELQLVDERKLQPAVPATTSFTVAP